MPQALESVPKLRFRLATAYLRRGLPLLCLTRWLRAPLRALFRLTPTLAHDRVHRWKPYLLRWSHELLVGEIPADYRIHRGELAFRSAGSEMSVHGYYVGDIEAHLLRWIETQLRPGFVMIDIGAHHGAFTLVVAHELRKRGWPGRIHAFEPDERNFKTLCHNVLQNNLQDYVELNHKAVAESNGRVSFLTNLKENSDNRLTAPTGPEVLPKMSESGFSENYVEAVRLDSIVAAMSRVDLVKMDTQGAELQVLRGGDETLRRFRPALLVEILSGFGGDSELRSLLERQGYSFYGVTRLGGLCPWGDPASYISWDCCCLPREGSARTETHFVLNHSNVALSDRDMSQDKRGNHS